MMGNKAADSDVRMMIATQVAYLDGDEGMTVKELVDRTIASYGSMDGQLSAQQQGQLDTAKYIREQIEAHDLQDCGRWVIKAVADDNAQSGFYGCLIDTRDGDAILGFRGSESFDNGQMLHDWVEADLGLLNNPQTAQQRRAEEFTRYIADRYGDYYNGYSFTGHSLGGNLAEHATITAPENMNIHRCVNLDGPGFSNEYIAAHGTQIGRRGQYIDHFQYSVVGSLLTPVPGSNYRRIAAQNDRETDGLESYLFRHHTRNIRFDENGKVQYGDGEFDPLPGILGPISRDVDNGAPLVLWITCPELAMMMTLADRGRELLLALKDRTEHLIESVRTTLQNMKEGIANWYRNMFGVALTGVFEINVSSVNALAGSLDSTAREFRSISNELAEIANKLHYNSLSGSCFKSRLRSMSSTLGRDVTKTYALATAARSCADYSARDDARAAQCYARL